MQLFFEETHKQQEIFVEVYKMKEEIICAKFCCCYLMIMAIFSQLSRHL